MQKEDKNWEGVEKYAVEVIEQARKQADRWFAAWFITLAALVGTNAAWIYVFQSYEYVQQYSDGVNNINSGSQGDVMNEPESAD